MIQVCVCNHARVIFTPSLCQYCSHMPANALSVASACVPTFSSRCSRRKRPGSPRPGRLQRHISPGSRRWPLVFSDIANATHPLLPPLHARCRAREPAFALRLFRNESRARKNPGQRCCLKEILPKANRRSVSELALFAADRVLRSLLQPSLRL